MSTRQSGYISPFVMRNQTPKTTRSRHNGAGRVVIDNDASLDRIAAHDVVPVSSSRPVMTRPTICPCCGGETMTPSCEMIVDRYRLRPKRARILEAVWKGKGYPVPAERIFDFMYSDDPDGGPSLRVMHNRLKNELSLLRKDIRGSGVGIEHVARRGYRLIMGDV